MGAAKEMERLGAWHSAWRLVAAAAALLAAFPPAARGAQDRDTIPNAAPNAAGDTVGVEWALSSNGSLVVLNVYDVRGGRPDPESVRGLVIERDPTVAATHRYAYDGPGKAYAEQESRRFIAELGISATTLDTLANGAKGSQFPAVLAGEEWTRLLGRLLVEGGMEITEAGHRVIVRPLAEPVRSLIEPDLDLMFSGQNPHPVFRHLQSGQLALSRGGVGAAREDSIIFGSVRVEKDRSESLYLRNYGARPVATELVFNGAAGDDGFSAGGVQRLAVEPGDSVLVNLRFAPRQVGARRAMLEFLVDGTPAVQLVLAGTGTKPGLLAATGEWMARWAWLLLVGLLGFVMALVVGRTYGVRMSFPRLRSRRKRPSFGGGATAQPVHPTTLPSAPPVVRTEDAAVRRQLVTARRAIQEALAALGEDGALGDGGSSADDGATTGGASRKRDAENLRRLRELERERDEFVEARSRLEESVGTIASERDSLARKVRTLETEQARLTQQVEALEGVRAENDLLRRQKRTADEIAADLRLDVTRITREREKLEERLRALAGVLELSDEMVSDAGWPEAQRRLPALRDGGKPRYLWNFEQLVADLTAIFEEIGQRAGEGRLAAAVNAVLAGSNNNAGLRTVGTELDRDALTSRLGLAHARELRTLNAERFYRDFVDRRFRPVIDNIAKLGSYARSRSPHIGMDQRLSREGVDPALLERALTLIETRMRVDFGVEVQLPRLFEECFDRARHESASHSTLRHTLPDLEPSIQRLPPDTIYDITSVGLRSDQLGVAVRPVVAWVPAQ